MKTHQIIGGGGTQLYVEESGNPSGQPILFLHGFSQSRLAWRKQMQSDLANDFRLISMDLRGHGNSDKPQDAYTDSRCWADDVNATISTLRLERPVLSGWSYGGFIISDYLRHYGDAALGGIQFVGGVSMIGVPEANGFFGPDFVALMSGFFSTNVEESATALKTFMRLCVHAEPTPEDFYLNLGYNTIVPPYVRQNMLSRTFSSDDVLRQIRVPMLITHGEADEIILVAAARHHAKIVPHAKLSLYREIGHAPFLEDAPRFNAELRSFVASL